MSVPTALIPLWSTPVGLYQCPEAEEINPVLVSAFSAMRLTNGLDANAFYASKDDLLNRVNLPEWQRLIRFIVNSLRDTVALANQSVWPESAPAMSIALRGVWFQFVNNGLHHDIHTHGNCSWSGVYCVQVDSRNRRQSHPSLGINNGITRFYGPYFDRLGGAYADFGNAYLQAPHWDVEPIPGQLVVFPSWLPHQAMPYEGEKDRLIISFNASVHRADGDDQLQGYARA